MKKYIAIATLIAAGTVASNASAYGTNTPMPVDLILSATGTNCSGYNGNTSGENVILALIKVATDFDVSTLSYNDFGISGDNASGITTSNDNLTIIGWSGKNSGNNQTRIENGNIAQFYFNETAGETGEQTISLTGSANYIIVAASGYWSTTSQGHGFSASNEFTLDTQDTSAGKLTGFNLAIDGITIPNSQTLATFTVTASAVPEPSAFGLLASLGALALVGARRRRK